MPLKLLGITDITGNSAGALLWSKGLGLLFLVLCYLMVYRIALLVLNSAQKAKNTLFIMAAGIPVFFLFQFSWGLYDTVWCFFY